MNNSVCPCGSGEAFMECCQKYILGYETAPTALALMRSRYSAYVVKNADYLIATTHESTRIFFSKDEILSWASENQWQKLKVIAFDATTVEFQAFFRGPDANDCIHHERSTFEKVNGHWFYIDGIFFEK
nr:YchJ family protein [uncultured Flavobacterium sp.]